MAFIRFNMSGLGDYTKKINQMDVDIKPAVTKAINEITTGIKDDLRPWLVKHKDTGHALESLNSSQVYDNGEALYAYAGIDSNIFEDAWKIAFVEYGTPTFDADPMIRKTYAKWKRRSKAIYQKYLDEVMK